MDSEESDDLWKSSDSSSSDYLQLMQNLKLHEEDKEELQMLASLRREQEEDEYGASSLSGLQVQECNISTSPDAPPWTPVCMVCIPSTPLLFLKCYSPVDPTCVASQLFTVISRFCVFPALPWNSFSDPCEVPLWLIFIAVCQLKPQEH